MLTYFAQHTRSKPDRCQRAVSTMWGHRVCWLPCEYGGPEPLVLDLRIAHDRWGSSSDPSINGTLHYPNDMDRSLNEAAADKIRKYRADYNNNPPSCVSFMPAIASTSGRLHSKFVRLLFLQAHRETDRFFAASRVQPAQSDRGQFHYKRAAFSSQLKSKVGNILAKAAAMRI